MDKERILNKIRELLREQPTVNTASTPSAAGFSSDAADEGPTAGYGKKLGKGKIERRKKYLSLGPGSRKRWMPDRQVPKNILGQ